MIRENRQAKRECPASLEAAGSAPGRLLAYMAGNTTRLFLGMLQEILRHLGSQVEACDFVIGDLYHFRWAQKQQVDPRIRLIYQHDEMDPFRCQARPDHKRLAYFEEKYGAPNLWRYILAQRIIDRLSYEEKLVYLQAYLEYFDNLCQRRSPDAFITGSPDSLPFLVSHEVFKRNGILTLVVIPSRVPGRFHVVDNDMEHVPYLEETYHALKEQPLIAREQSLAAMVRQAYVEKKLRPSYFGLGPRVRALPSPVRLVTTLLRRFWYDDWYFSAWLREDFRNSVRVRARWPFQVWDIRRLTSPFPSDGKFFYYPLHYEPEFSIDVLGTNVRDQIQVIQRVSSALPAGYTLCVKEHPNMFPGSRPLGFYRRLARLGNVRLLDPRTDGYEVISRCRGVVTIAGTAGFEALFYGKPVLIFGRAFYDAFREGVTRAGSYEELPHALEEMAMTRSFDPALLDCFIVALYLRSYEGCFETTIEGVYDPSNCAVLASGVIAELSFRLNRVEGATGSNLVQGEG